MAAGTVLRKAKVALVSRLEVSSDDPELTTVAGVLCATADGALVADTIPGAFAGDTT